ncbi:MAG: hypothetical protein WCF84_04225 [Anaerolineae bacterium]
MAEIRTGLVTGAFARFLEADRARLNAQFVEARRDHVGLDPEAFADLLRTTVAPIVAAVERVQSDAAIPVADCLYALSLTLLGEGFLGPASRYPAIGKGWRELLPALARFLVVDPRRVAGAVTNALYNLSTTGGARPDEWVTRVQQIAALPPDGAMGDTSGVDALLRAGQVAAWRAGLAHYRRGAFALCHTLEPPAARIALGLAPAATPVDGILDRLAADPWLDPAAAERPASGARECQIVARAGAFRGLGGLFLAPPTVTAAGEYFDVTDGETHWLLIADRFGATFHRVDALPAPATDTPFRIDKQGRVTNGESSRSFPELANATSAAGNGATLAVTTALSYAVSLVALSEG